MRITGIDWRLDVRYREKSFAGTVRIEIEDASDPVVVDSDGLTIDSAILDGVPAPFRVDTARRTLEFPGVSAQPHRLEIAYRGAAEPNSLVGMYVSPSGPGYVLTTMAFPTGARRFLPAFEHPAVKTVYRLRLSVEEEARVIFNTAPATERTVDGRKELVFEPTPPMSAYLLYLCIGPFEVLTVPGDRWSVTVATSPGRSSAGRYGAERATELLAGTRSTTPCRTPSPSSTWSPSRTSGPARWRTGARSPSGRTHCSSIRAPASARAEIS